MGEKMCPSNLVIYFNFRQKRRWLARVVQGGRLKISCASARVGSNPTASTRKHSCIFWTYQWSVIRLHFSLKLLLSRATRTISYVESYMIHSKKTKCFIAGCRMSQLLCFQYFGSNLLCNLGLQTVTHGCGADSGERRPSARHSWKSSDQALVAAGIR